MASPNICDDPNKHARQPSIEFGPESAVIHGYQQYRLTRAGPSPLREDEQLRKKQQLLTPYFTQSMLTRRSFLDLGANGGFFSFWSLIKGAERAIGIDMDPQYVEIIRKAGLHFEFTNVKAIRGNVVDQTQPEDVVCAMALVHWIYSCTAVMGSLAAVVKYLAELTKYLLLVEWVAPDDPAIQFFHHTEWNQGFVTGPYTEAEFFDAMNSSFARIELVGQVTDTRRIYAAFKSKKVIDLSGALPILREKEKILSRRRLAIFKGIDYWSCVYDEQLQECVLKQGTLDLASREALLLNQVEGPYFPRVRGWEDEGEWSQAEIEWIDGVPIDSVSSEMRETAEVFLSLAMHCLKLLAELEAKGIQHRDIRPDNILIRNGQPVLIDFGWAVGRGLPYFTPANLGGDERPPDGSFSDIYSMGKVLEMVNDHRLSQFDPVIELMVEPDESLREVRLGVLAVVFRVAAAH